MTESMTGFARAEGRSSDLELVWEVRSVNGKGFDLRLRLPPGYERIEPALRSAAKSVFARGNLQATLSVSADAAAIRPIICEEFLRDISALAERLAKEHGFRPASADGILALRGVIDFRDPAECSEAHEAIDEAAVAAFSEALDRLKASRVTEGEQLKPVLLDHLSRIEQLTRKAEADPSRTPEAIRARIQEQLKLILGEGLPVDEGRLATEAAFLASKADIREEIDRLKSHVATARELISADGPCGRKLDFLAQEFNRESNTLCSKSNAAAITAIGLDLKTVVEQFREQIQNIE